MDLASISELLSNSPQWLQLGIGCWLLVGVVLLAILLVFRPSPTAVVDSEVPPIASNPLSSDQSDFPPPNTSIPAPVLVQPSTIEHEPMPEQFSIKKYFSRIAELDGRFLQKQEFIRSMSGKTVVWDGFVVEVLEEDFGMFVALDPNVPGVPVVSVVLSKEFRTQLFSLRRRDHIRVEGVLAEGIISVRGQKISILSIPTE